MNCMNAKIKLFKKNIEDVCIDDVVLSHDLTHKKNVVKQVTDVFTPIIKSTDQFEFITNTDNLVMSNFHRMWVDKGGDRDWIAAENINVGNSLVDINNVSISINKINNNFDTDETFYDLSIEDTHNYFVGNTNYYLSHNSATVNFAWFHYDIMDILVLKNNAGTDDNRVRKLDYCVGLDKLIYERFLKNQDVTLFSYHECPSLWNSFGFPDFKEKYEKAEINKNIKFKKKVSARELMSLLAKERLETGRIYTMNVDHANEHGSWLDQVDTSNLCLHPDTLVSTVIDNIPMKLSIKELDDLFRQNKNISVLSKNTDNQEISYKEVLNSSITGIDMELLEITDEESGFTIKCTGDHLIFTKNRGYVKAKDLNEMDILDVI